MLIVLPIFQIISFIISRLLLTRENFSIQIMVMEVLKQVMRASQEDLIDRKKEKRRGNLNLI